MITGIHNCFNTVIPLVETNFLDAQSGIQKRIMVIAACVFAFILATYFLCKYHSKKFDIQKKVDETKASPLEVPKKVLQINAKLRHQYLIEDCRQLINSVYEKKFLDPDDDYKVKVIDDFAAWVQKASSQNRIEINIYDVNDIWVEQLPDSFKRSGCHYRAYFKQDGSSHQEAYEIAFSEEFLNEFSTYREGNDLAGCKTLLLRVVDEMDLALEGEERRIAAARRRAQRGF